MVRPGRRLREGLAVGVNESGFDECLERVNRVRDKARAIKQRRANSSRVRSEDMLRRL